MNQAMAYVMTTVLLIMMFTSTGCAPEHPRFFNPKDFYEQLDRKAPYVQEDNRAGNP